MTWFLRGREELRLTPFRVPGKEGLTSAEREELSRLRRPVRQLQTERDILAFAVRGEKASTPP